MVLHVIQVDIFIAHCLYFSSHQGAWENTAQLPHYQHTLCLKPLNKVHIYYVNS